MCFRQQTQIQVEERKVLREQILQNKVRVQRFSRVNTPTKYVPLVHVLPDQARQGSRAQISKHLSSVCPWQHISVEKCRYT